MKKVKRPITVISIFLLASPLRAADDGGLLRTGYRVALGDNMAAGEGAMPVTVG